MAGSISFLHNETRNGISAIRATCTADAADGSYPATALPAFAGVILSIATNPGSPAPTDNYDITLVDQDGLDRLNGAGADRDTTTSERATVSGASAVYLGEPLLLTLTNNIVNSAVTVVTIYYSAVSSAATSGGSVTVTGDVGVSSIASGDNTVGRVKITDGSQVAEVLDLTTNDALAVALMDASGNHITFPVPIDIAVTPTLDTSAYASGDSLHTTVMTFANAAATSAGTGTITKLVVNDDDNQGAAGELWIFHDSVTPTTANSAHAISDADAAKCIGVIPFGPYYAGSNNQVSVNSGVSLSYHCTATSLYGIAVTRGTPTYTSAGLDFHIYCVRD